MVEFEVPGDIIGWQRTGYNKFTGAKYTQPKTRNKEREIAMLGKAASRGIFFEKDVPLKLVVYAYYKIPDSTTNKKRERMKIRQILPVKKPDWDNVGKLVGDALNQVLYHDDAQIIMGTVIKVYDDDPKLVISVQEIE